jgi:hypothetical protein
MHISNYYHFFVYFTKGTQSYEAQVKSWGSIFSSSCLVFIEGCNGDGAGEFCNEGSIKVFLFYYLFF